MHNLKINLMMLATTILAGCAPNKTKQDKTLASAQIKNVVSANKTAAIVVKKDTLAFTYKYLRADEKNCPNKNDCSYVELSYPVFKSASRLNKTIAKSVLSFLNDENGSIRNVDKIFKGFSDDFFGDPDSTDSQRMAASTLGLQIDTMVQDSSLAIIQLADEMSGGAHPNENVNYINWNTKADLQIRLDDILKSGYKTRLTEIAETIFRKDEHLGKSDALDGYFFKDGIFTLNDNFQITPSGLSYYYNNYEIKPYSEGPTVLLIPYTKIKSLLKPNTVLAQYLK